MEELKQLISERSLEHIAIIMDGNGRWATQKGEDRSFGHRYGSERVIEIAQICSDLGIKVLSIYAFSTENWKRPEKEVVSIFSLLNKFISRELDTMMQKNIKLNIMGDVTKLPMINRKAVLHAVNKTEKNTGLILNIGLNYGSRDELSKAFKDIYKLIEDGSLRLEDVNEDIISQNLFTGKLPDPDILIRTGGEKRVSNFMLYQIAYSEFYFIDTLWPDFISKNLLEILRDFFKRDRRYGGVNAN